MTAKEITKPSLTQRRKVSGSKSLSSAGKVASSPVKVSGNSDDISIGKVIMIIMGVVILAIIAAFLVQFLQGGGESDTDPEATTVKDTTTIIVDDNDLTSTGSISDSSDTTEDDTTIVESNDDDPEPPVNEQLDNNFGSSTQYINSGASGASFRIRTYQWENQSSYYEFNLPVARESGSYDYPNAKASYNSDGDLELTIENITSFSSCSWLNDNNSGMEYGNVLTVTCKEVDGNFVFTLDTKTETDFKLTTGLRKINSGEEVEAIIVQVNNK